jgi:hypothetical protein
MKNTLGIILFAALVTSNTALAGTGKQKTQELTGSWKIQVTLPPGASACPASAPSPCLFQAMATLGKDGTAVQTAALSGVSTGHGVWTRTGNRKFRVHTTYFRFDELGQVIGTAETVTLINLDKTGQNASGTYENVLQDPNGAEVGRFTAPVTGERLIP